MERRRQMVIFTHNGHTQQHMKNDADVNQIVSRYKKTGVMQQGYKIPSFGDYSQNLSYRQAQEIVLEARQSFAALPGEVRRRFNQDPAAMIEFLQDPKNREEAKKMGLLEPDKPIAPKPPLEVKLDRLVDALSETQSDKNQGKKRSKSDQNE